MNPTQLILARHGQAHCNVRGIIGSPRGYTGLTDHGHHQAHQLADRLRTDHAQTPITTAYTTPLRRARETADIIGHHLDLPVTTVADLREPDYGDADGKPWTDVVGPGLPKPGSGARWRITAGHRFAIPGSRECECLSLVLRSNAVTSMNTTLCTSSQLQENWAM
jgi:Histidine phosphatase superfamily (branch 1)